MDGSQVQNGLISAVGPEAPTQASNPAPPAPSTAQAAPAPSPVQQPQVRRQRIDDTPVPQPPPKEGDKPAFEWIDLDEPTGDTSIAPALAETGEAETPAETPTPAKPTYSPDLIARAQEHGFSEADLRDLGDEAAATLVFNKLDRQHAQAFRRGAAPQPQQTAQGQATPTVDTPAPATPTFDRAKLLEQFAPELVDMLEANFNSAMAATNEANQLKQTVAQMQAVEQQRQQEAFRVKMDAIFNDLGSEFAPLFGEGEITRLRRDSVEVANRNDAIQIGRGLQQVLAARGVNASEPSLVRAAAIALRELSGGPPATTQQQQADTEPKPARQTPDRNATGQFVARANAHSGTPYQTGDFAALENIREKTGAAGRAGTASDKDVRDSLL